MIHLPLLIIKRGITAIVDISKTVDRKREDVHWK